MKPAKFANENPNPCPDGPPPAVQTKPKPSVAAPMKPATAGERIVLDDLADNEHALRQLRTDGKYTRKALLARAIDAAIAEAVAKEREACAAVADEQQKEPECPERASYIADAIRARGNP